MGHGGIEKEATVVQRLLSFYAGAELVGLTSRRWPVIREIPNGSEGYVNLSSYMSDRVVLPIFDCAHYEGYENGFGIGVKGWNVQFIGLKKVDRNDLSVVGDASFELKIMLWNGRKDTESMDEVYRVLLSEPEADQLKAVIVQRFVGLVDRDGETEVSWVDANSLETSLLLGAVRRIKNFMADTRRKSVFNITNPNSLPKK